MSHSQKFQQHVCLSCKKPEGGAVSGSSYISNGDNGMIVRFWLCDDCAMTLGPSQGPIDMDEPEARQQRV
ncbi:hypothetical protein F0U60_06745 [Archangium minus]|uniref:Uncharacterized protein n=1 Tax=Archangium minus TaxID=83450 RepID=A0ABY9WKN1_9BACT|nr:hypothetical protein F0U61_06825 [Archangium violaceum]WNG43828.1 hypothetical protein F0U60_06745 [Archangium minus]